MTPRLPLAEEQLDGRLAPAHLRPFVPRVHALIEAALRLRDELGHGPEGPHADPIPDACEERWFWQRQLRMMAADLARLVAGRRARDKEAAAALDGFRRGDHIERMKYEAIASLLVRLGDEGPNADAHRYGESIAAIDTIERRVEGAVEAEWAAASPAAAAAEEQRRQQRDQAWADRKAKEAEQSARLAAAPSLNADQVAEVQALLDRHATEIADTMATIGDAVGTVTARSGSAHVINGHMFITVTP